MLRSRCSPLFICVNRVTQLFGTLCSPLLSVCTQLLSCSFRAFPSACESSIPSQAREPIDRTAASCSTHSYRHGWLRPLPRAQVAHAHPYSRCRPRRRKLGRLVCTLHALCMPVAHAAATTSIAAAIIAMQAEECCASKQAIFALACVCISIQGSGRGDRSIGPQQLADAIARDRLSAGASSCLRRNSHEAAGDRLAVALVACPHILQLCGAITCSDRDAACGIPLLPDHMRMNGPSKRLLATCRLCWHQTSSCTLRSAGARRDPGASLLLHSPPHIGCNAPSKAGSDSAQKDEICGNARTSGDGNLNLQ